MKKIIITILITLGVYGSSYSQVILKAKMSKISTDTTWYKNVGSAVRGSWVANDIDGNGKPELILTDYSNGGRVYVFEAVGEDSVELRWSSPKQDASIGNGSSPRCVRAGDLDGDGKQEIIFPTNAGYYIYEWDGVKGSCNFGDAPSQIINSTTLPDISNFTIQRNESFDVVDIDGDGIQELVTNWNNRPTSDNQYLVVIRAVSTWDTGNPGFSSFSLDYKLPKNDLYGGGQSMPAFVGQFDGEGNKDILVHTWNNLNVFPVRVLGPGNYAPSDTSKPGAFIHIMKDDAVALLGGIVTDIDNDGVDELYLPVYQNDKQDVPGNGQIYIVSYKKGEDFSRIDSTDVALISESPSKMLTGNTAFKAVLFGGDWADLNNDGKKSLYFGSTTPADLIRLEYLGGDKKDSKNWKPSILYAGEPDVYSTISYRDSAGVKDTVKTLNTPFVSKLFGKNMDFNGNGKPDILLPYQGLVDSITIKWLHYDLSSSSFVTDSTMKKPNPKIWFGRIVEYTGPTGIKVKNLAFITPEDYKLEQNYPNPFNPSTKIRFMLPLDKKISLKIYDILGNEVKTVIDNQDFTKGSHEVVWDGTNNFGRQVASGQYIYTLKFGNFSKSMKMTLLK